MKFLVPVFLLLASACSAQTFYIVRHAEKAAVPPGADRTMAADPELSDIGLARAQALKTWLKDIPLSHAYSTSFKRTLSTAGPAAEVAKISIVKYAPYPDSLPSLVNQWRSLSGNVLIVGHSNTIDDIANALTGEKVVPGDLPETEYDNIFIVRKEGEKWVFERTKY